MKRHSNREKAIIDLFIKGDSRAMRRLYDDYAAYLNAVCMRYIPDEDTRKDVLQETFIRIYTKIADFEWRGEGSLKAWMARICANEALQSIRHSKSDLFEDTDFDTLNADGSVSMETEDPDSDVDTVPQQELLRMIGELPEGYRAVFNLYVFEGMSHKEIAATLGIKENSSASQFHRAKAMLAGKVKAYRKATENI